MHRKGNKTNKEEDILHHVHEKHFVNSMVLWPNIMFLINQECLNIFSAILLKSEYLTNLIWPRRISNARINVGLGTNLQNTAVWKEDVNFVGKKQKMKKKIHHHIPRGSGTQ